MADGYITPQTGSQQAAGQGEAALGLGGDAGRGEGDGRQVDGQARVALQGSHQAQPPLAADPTSASDPGD